MEAENENPEPDKKPPSKKSDKATVAQRVEEVLRIRLSGAQFHDIVQYAAEKGWGVNDRQIREYIRRTDDLLVERHEKKRRPLIARRVAQREELFARCINAADFRTALAVLIDLDKLRGLYPEKEAKELAKLAVAQGMRIEELERRLRDSGIHPPPTEAASPQTGSAGTGDAEPDGPA